MGCCPVTQLRIIQRAFNGGEVTPEFWGRTDDGKYFTGLAVCRNFIPLPHGPTWNRAGFAFVRAVKDSTKQTRVIPFSFSTTQTMVLELGAGYFRFHTQGATLLVGAPAAYNGATAYTQGALAANGGVNYYAVQASTGHAPPNATYWYPIPSDAYEIPNGYAEADLFSIKIVQSADVLTLTHPNYAPMELRRMGATTWVLTPIVFATSLVAPTGETATPTTPAGTTNLQTYSYVVTSVDSTGLQESLKSSAATCNNNLLAIGAYNDIAWSVATSAAFYNVYRLSAGTYGFIGQTDQLTLRDDDVTPNPAQTPPFPSNPFDGPGDYPGAVSYFEQRRCFAGTLNAPQDIWMTRSATESNLDYSIPTRDNDSINFRIAAREANTIRHIVPLTNLILLTSSAEWRVTSINTDALTPTSFSVRPQSYIGASDVAPVIVNNNLLYAAARGGHMREMAYSFQADGYITGDLSLRAPHLFDGLTLVDMAYVKSPHPVVWAVSSNGDLLGLTYVPEQQVGAWHHHDTDGVFESVAVVAEGNEDALYVVVQRQVNGSSVRYIERMASRLTPATPADYFFVDSGLTYSGAPASTLSGLDHLEGKTVSILADGAVHPQQVVVAGMITLEEAASTVQVGLPITADIQTLPFATQVEADAQGRPKNVNRVFLRVVGSSGIFAGPDVDDLAEAKQRTTEPYGAPPSLKTDEIEIVVKPSWGDSGQVFIRQQDPLPLTILSVTVEAEVGG